MVLLVSVVETGGGGNVWGWGQEAALKAAKGEMAVKQDQEEGPLGLTRKRAWP